MRVLQFIDVPWDSGLAHYALVLSQELKRKGHQVFISALPGQKPWLKARSLGLKTVPLATLRGLQPLRHFLKDHGIQVLNAHTGSTHSLAVASALGQPVAVVRTRSDARSVRSKVGSGFLYKHTHRVIAAADYIRESYLNALKLPGRKVVTVYQGISLNEFSVTPFPTKPTVGIVARLDPVKGHRYLLEAIELLRNIYPQLKVKVVGQDENIKQRELLQMAGRLDIETRVEFLGYQSSIPKIMSECTIGVIASIGSEAVSRVALEWMAAGRPVVGTRVGCLPEIVKESETGHLVDPKDAPALARALGALLHYPEQIEKMGAAARQRVEEQFALSDFANQTLDVYNAAMKESGCLN
jgi:glycosyltransferase involved in cell wall biosynthesis